MPSPQSCPNGSDAEPPGVIVSFEMDGLAQDNSVLEGRFDVIRIRRHSAGHGAIVSVAAQTSWPLGFAGKGVQRPNEQEMEESS